MGLPLFTSRFVGKAKAAATALLMLMALIGQAAAARADYRYQAYTPSPRREFSNSLRYYPETAKLAKDFLFRTAIPWEFESEASLRNRFMNLRYPVEFALARFKDSDIFLIKVDSFSGRRAFKLLIYAKCKDKWRLAALDKNGIEETGPFAKGFHVSVKDKGLVIDNDEGTVSTVDFSGAEKALSRLSKEPS